MKTTKTRRLIIKYLTDNGPASSHQIFDHVNEHSYYGTSAAALGNILAQMPEVKRKERVMSLSAGHDGFKVWSWELKE